MIPARVYYEFGKMTRRVKMMRVSKPGLISVVLLVCQVGCGDSGPTGPRKGTILYGFDDVLDFPLEKVAPLNPDSDYAEALADCTYNVEREQHCTLSKLPFLGMSVPEPTIDDVMSRVIASKPWMAENFRKVLESMQYDIDFRLLCRAVTAIVISNDIRPSFYYAGTGAIYIDSDHLWLTEEQKKQTNRKPDFRTNFGSKLRFLIVWRLVKDNAQVYSRTVAFPNFDSAQRTVEDIQISLAYLLYHELAHANDYNPYEKLSGYEGSMTPWAAASTHEPVSSDFDSAYPLESELLKKLAEVSFFGYEATSDLVAVGPEEVVEEFRYDTATNYYNYSNPVEDLAMTFGAMMMLWRFEIQEDVGITPIPEVENPTAYDIILTWGQRQRVADPEIRAKAWFAINRILPGLEGVDAFIQGLEDPIELPAGVSWAESIDVSGGTFSVGGHPPLQTLPIDGSVELP